MILSLKRHISGTLSWNVCRPDALLSLLTADVLSEEAILKWYSDAHLSKGRSVFLEQMKKFVEWLKNAEEGEKHKPLHPDAENISMRLFDVRSWWWNSTVCYIKKKSGCCRCNKYKLDRDMLMNCCSRLDHNCCCVVFIYSRWIH